MFEKWIDISSTEIAGILLTAFFAYAAVMVYTRVTGLRSFSKMSAPDFAMTIATGSILGATISQPSPTLFAGSLALLSLFTLQWAVAFFRRRSRKFSACIDNQPVLLMAGSTILHENLHRANLTVNDLMGKLRESNACSLNDVQAVVFETTGDISVLHSKSNEPIDPLLLQNVYDAQRLIAD
ncbi:putative membrane protein [Rhodopirellula islandica]|uniref:Membrane protein n=1 Tax=Rhodopirellula islandica TaxID=595434 RepID=A0A0J1BHL9_RHOIS|nr:YetF domain-containing protein [Rhodopirellula islandica]KLU06031.1 putative membrane protein [Rhodopirellula islandica]